MYTNLKEFTAAQLQDVCEHADMTALCDYINDPLETPAANEVENHLLDCRACREFFLMMVSVRSEARLAKTAPRDDGSTESDANVVRIAKFRKET